MKTFLTCITGTFAGLAAVILFVVLFYWGMNLFFVLDGRYFMGRFPLFSLASMGVVFLAAFFWQYARESRKISKR